MGMNEVASSILPMLETVIQGDETEVAGPRSLIWVWSTGVYGDWKLPFLVQEVDPLLT
jgi:hypothetical protein